MSGAFETAAGAFAVVGVVDVLVRTGRDLYSFLRDVTEAPEDIIRLGDVIRDCQASLWWLLNSQLLSLPCDLAFFGGDGLKQLFRLYAGLQEACLGPLESAALIKQSLSLNHGAGQAEQSGREIYFLGARSDQILAYLLPFQDDLDFAIDYVISQYSEDISIGDADWLRSESERLVSSASQEKALQYPNSTATPLDQWSYAEDIVEYLKSATRPHRTIKSYRTLTTLKEDDDDDCSDSVPLQCTKRSQRAWLVSTNSGQIKLSFPNHRNKIKAPRGIDEVGFSYTAKHNHSTWQIRARFLRRLNYASKPRICAHLHVFVQVDFNSSTGTYGELLEMGTVSEIDAALRAGTISPFCIDGDGDNMLLWHASYARRMDVLDYLATQGIGQRALK
ncbi:hypothetical protein DE146DRAFT_766096 [Phaeosphaeria sp. MPI-PUGE-AT-0046c]|nr:hypothetical protein DE146DRAFT_766096 [Phaeosphaeria sp. MPI-PUGE-AT-0046c]